MRRRTGLTPASAGGLFTVLLAASTLPLAADPARAQLRCPDDGSQRIADQIRKALPDTLPPEDRRVGRNQYLIRHSWELIDQNRDGKIDFGEYLAGEWAGYLVQGSSHNCFVTRDEFMQRFLGLPSDPHSGWRVPSQIAVISALYRGLDRDRKGYLVEDDIRQRAEASFRFSDRHHDGFLTPDEWR